MKTQIGVLEIDGRILNATQLAAFLSRHGIKVSVEEEIKIRCVEEEPIVLEDWEVEGLDFSRK